MRWGDGKRISPGPLRLVAFLMGAFWACVENCCVCVAFTCLSCRGLCVTSVWRCVQFRILELPTSLSAKLQLKWVGSFHQLKGLLCFCCCRFYDREIRPRGQRKVSPPFFPLPNLPSFQSWTKSFPSSVCFLQTHCFTCLQSDACPLDLSWHGALFLRKETDSGMECENRTADLAQWQGSWVLCATHRHFQ